MVRTAAIALVGSVLLVGASASAQGYSVVGPGGGSSGGGASTGTSGAASGGAGGGGQAVVVGRGGAGGVVATHQPWEYGGVVPGNGVTPPGLSRHSVRNSHGRAIVAWPGFQVTRQGSRIFLAVTSQVQLEAEPSRAAGRVVYRIRNAIVPVRNNRRALETEAFDTPVRRAFLRQHGRDVELVVEMRAQGAPQVSQQNNTEGLGFVYLDFQPYTAPRDTGATTTSAPGPNAGIRRAAPVEDTERPPPVQR